MPSVTFACSCTRRLGFETCSPAGTAAWVIGDVAEIVAVPALTPVITKYAELLPAGTVTVAGTVSLVGSDDVSVTTTGAAVVKPRYAYALPYTWPTPSPAGMPTICSVAVSTWIATVSAAYPAARNTI